MSLFTRWAPWIMLAIWSSWASAAQGLLAHPGRLHLWAPDLGLVLLIACAGRFESRDVPLAAIVVGLSRAAFSIEPPAALLFGLIAAGTIVVGVRSVAEVNGPLMRTAIAFVASWIFAAWLLFVHFVRVERADGAEPYSLTFLFSMWRGALVTALLALTLGPLLAYLPGLTRLRRRRW